VDLFFVLFQYVGVDQDVVEIANTENIEVFMEDIVHALLGSGWSIGEPEQHNQEFE